MYIMTLNVTLSQWGNSVGLRVPKAILDLFDLKPGMELAIKPQENGFSVEAVEQNFFQKMAAQSDETLEELCAKMADFDLSEMYVDDGGLIGREADFLDDEMDEGAFT
jgi:antitoxin component of MazEF toxin-antitoxin module